MASIRAIYRNGQLQPLDPVELTDGQEVRIQILDEHSRVIEALSELLVQTEEIVEEPFDEAKLQREIDAVTQGITISDLVIEDRRTGR
jgi:predicted DNA-binding antitoxin AbrB/MazE fold protein